MPEYIRQRKGPTNGDIALEPADTMNDDTVVETAEKTLAIDTSPAAMLKALRAGQARKMNRLTATA